MIFYFFEKNIGARRKIDKYELRVQPAKDILQFATILLGDWAIQYCIYKGTSGGIEEGRAVSESPH
jgi:hypothetical protein